MSFDYVLREKNTVMNGEIPQIPENQFRNNSFNYIYYMYKGDFTEARQVRDKISNKYAIVAETYHNGSVCYLVQSKKQLEEQQQALDNSYWITRQLYSLGKFLRIL